MAGNIIINGSITVPAAELSFTASRSSGPGGQHVNTTDSRIQVRWNLEQSKVFTDAQKARLRRGLQSRLTESGDLILASDSHRSQRRNREEVAQRLAALLREHLTPPKPRKKTRPTLASRERRLEEKKRRAFLKKNRGGGADD
jgi:ribosome-associated protein